MAHDKPHDKWQIWNDPEEALRRRESLIERQIREAQLAGQFDNLPGYGKPIPKDDGQDLAPDRWMSNRILKQAGYVPQWIELRKEIAAERDEVVQALAAYRELARSGDGSNPVLARMEQRYIELATAINKKIDQHNGECPKGQLLTRFVEDATRRWS